MNDALTVLFASGLVLGILLGMAAQALLQWLTDRKAARRVALGLAEMRRAREKKRAG